MFVRKRILVMRCCGALCCLMLSVLCVPRFGFSAELIDRIIAVVNDDIVSLYELESMYNPFAERIKSMGYPPEQQKTMLYQLREDLINQLIEQKLTEQETRRTGIYVDEREIDETIERMKQSHFMTDEEFQQALLQEGITPEAYRKNVRLQLLRNRLVSREVTSRVVITDDDIRAYYEHNADKFTKEAQYHLRMILMRLSRSPNEAEKNAVRLKMERVYQRLESGEDFAQLAAVYSEGRAESGGDLGMFPFSKLAAHIQQAVKTLPAGQYTDIMLTNLGYQIFFVENIIESESTSIEEAAVEIRQKLMEEGVDQKIREWLEALKNKSHIRIIR